MSDILIISPTRAEAGPLASVIAALPEAQVHDMEFIGRPSAAYCHALDHFDQVFGSENPKLILLLGDRYETHAAALAAHFLRIPIAHIHGGETTTGAFDDALRHGITHMAGETGLHFVATRDAKEKVRRLIDPEDGPNSQNVHLVGAPGLDSIKQNSAKRDQKIIVVSYYPETNLPDGGHRQLRQMIKHLDQFTPDHAIFFSRVNSDPGHELITAEIQEFIDTFPESAAWISPNTREQYLHLCEHAKFVIGNTSSIPIEMPWLGVPAVLVGSRQDGRPLAASIVTADDYVSDAIDFALKELPPSAFDPIYRGGAAPKIAAIVRDFVK